MIIIDSDIVKSFISQPRHRFDAVAKLDLLWRRGVTERSTG